MAQATLYKNKKHFTKSTAYPWVVISLCASILFYKYVLSVSPSIMAHELMKQFQLNGVQMGNLAATFFYTYTIVQVFSGILLDKYGARFLTGFCVLVAALGAYLFSYTESLSMALVARGLMGFGIAFATVAYFKMTATWFKPNQRAFVGGLLATAVTLGAVFGESPLAWLVNHTSWRHVLFLCSFMGLVIALLFMFFVRDQPPSPLGILGQTQPIRQGFSLSDLWSVLRNKQNWLLTLYSGLAFSPLSVLGGLWGNPFLQEAYHLSRTQGADLISLMFIGLGIGSPLLGLLSDRLGKRLPIMKVGALFSLFSLLAILYVPMLPIAVLSGLFFLLGCSVGAFMLGFMVGAEINNISLAATVVALINTGDAIFESLTEPLVGKFLDLSWNGGVVDGVHHFTVQNYHIALLLLPFYFLLSFTLLWFLKEPTLKAAIHVDCSRQPVISGQISSETPG